MFHLNTCEVHANYDLLARSGHYRLLSGPFSDDSIDMTKLWAKMQPGSGAMPFRSGNGLGSPPQRCAARALTGLL